METVWDSLTEDAWNDCLAGAGAALLQQSWRYGTVVAALGARVGRAVIRDGGHEVAVAQAVARRLNLAFGQAQGNKAGRERHLSRAVLAPADQDPGFAAFGRTKAAKERHHVEAVAVCVQPMQAAPEHADEIVAGSLGQHPDAVGTRAEPTIGDPDLVGPGREPVQSLRLPSRRSVRSR